ncbi:MAG: cob(I)yrinic acid a,c-diamide adenosyltransferase [Oligoflexia bacterium]|nr:cob(I)yrinic acid a,c-diamide adenosyltransferase [Oligoflexia bacterium]
MKIYTKKGDQGETGLFGNVRVPKDDLRIGTYGTIDELNASLGVVLAELNGGAVRVTPILERLLRVQGELFQLGAELATPKGREVPTALLADADTARLEQEIDEMESALEPLKTFILPGGGKVSAYLHLARTISRRAERELISLHHKEPCRKEALAYMNRLSDYLFVTARFANHAEKQPDIAWVAPPKK